MDKVCFEQSGSAVHMRKNCNGATRKDEITMMQKVASIALALGLLTECALGESKPEPSSVQGVIFTSEQDHARSVVPGTKLWLDGALHLEAESDSDGTFVFSSVPAGSYTITAQAPGLTATQNIEVRAVSVSHLELEMKVHAVTESRTVTTNSDPVETTQASKTNVIQD